MTRKKISGKIKKQLAKEIGKQVKKLVQKNIKGATSEALLYAKKYAEGKTLSVIEESRFLPEKPTNRVRRFKIKVKGIKNIVEDVLGGEEIRKSIKNNLGVSVSFNIKW